MNNFALQRTIKATRAAIPAKFRMRAERYWPLVAAFLFQAVFLLLFWQGVGLRDAARYLDTALDWTVEGAQLGDNHWALRFPLVLPMALSLKAFGGSEFAAALPNILYSSALIAISFFFAKRHFNRNTASVLALLLATSPFFNVQPAEIRIYGAEVFFSALSLWLCVEAAAREKRDFRLLAAAGVAAGLAWLCRESAIFLAPAVAFAIWFPMRSAPFRIWLSATAVALSGFFLVIIAELSFYAVVAGDPLYRYLIDLGHGGGDPNQEVLGVGVAESWVQFVLRPILDLALYPLALPVVLISLAAALWAWRAAAFRRSVNALMVFIAAAALSTGLASYILNLDEVEYFPMLVYAALLMISYVICTPDLNLSARQLAAFAAGIIAIHAALADFVNYDEMSETRHALKLAAVADQTVLVDPITHRRARLLARLASREAVDAAPASLQIFRAEPECSSRSGAVIALRGSPTPGKYYFQSPLSKTVAPNIVSVRRESRLRSFLSEVGIIDGLPKRAKARLRISPPTELYSFCR